MTLRLSSQIIKQHPTVQNILQIKKQYKIASLNMGTESCNEIRLVIVRKAMREHGLQILRKNKFEITILNSKKVFTTPSQSDPQFRVVLSPELTIMAQILSCTSLLNCVLTQTTRIHIYSFIRPDSAHHYQYINITHKK